MYIFSLGAMVQYSLIECSQWYYRTKLPWIIRVDCTLQEEINVYVTKIGAWKYKKKTRELCKEE